jgi:uncharacterized protein (TIGR03086 family)
MTTPTTDLLGQGLAWTAARVAAVPPDALDNPTPCSLFDLRELLDHLIGSLTTLVDAAGPEAPTPVPVPAEVVPLGPTPWDRAMADLAARSAATWRTPGVLDRTLEIPLGRIPAPVVARITLLEAVVHGWDISRASGEAADIPVDIPAELAVPILDFARQAITDATRVDRFAADVGPDVGRRDSPSDRLVAYLGRKPQ